MRMYKPDSFLSVSLKLSGQNSLEDTILTPEGERERIGKM